jgi:xanthine dehydrogenase accessory factor
VSVLRVLAPASARPGDKAVVTAEGIQQGWIGGGCAQPAVMRTVRQALVDGRARVIRIAPAEEGRMRELDDVLEFGMACHSGGTLDLFVDPLLPAPRLVVVGDTPLAAALAGLAPRVGLPVTLLAHGADATRFPDAERVITSDDPGAEIAPGSFVVVATQGRRDVQGLRAALSLRARQVFFVASARKAQVLKAALLEAGEDAAAVDAIVAPAGQAIGAATPEEIALSVLAAVVAARRGAAENPALTATAAEAAQTAQDIQQPQRAAAAAAVAGPSTPAARQPTPLPDLPPIAGSCCGGGTTGAAAVANAAPALVQPTIESPAPAARKGSCCGG